MSGRIRNFLIGLTTIVAIGGLTLLLFLFGELQAVLNPRYVLTINTNNAAGLRAGSLVELNGVPIGNVDAITVGAEGRFPVQITALIDQEQRIPAAAGPYATASLLGGSATLQLEVEPQSEAPSAGFLSTDGRAEISGEIRIRLLDQLTSELDSRMAPLLAALEDFQRLSDAYLELGVNLNQLVQPLDPDATPQQRAANIHTAVAKLNTVLDDVSEALGLATTWLADEQLLADARNAIGNANALIGKATETLDQFQQLAMSIESDADTLTTRLLPVAEELTVTLEEVRRLARLAREGDGTIAMLLNNPDLYLSLEDTAIRLDQALRDLQLLLRKIRAEGLPLDIGP